MKSGLEERNTQKNLKIHIARNWHRKINVEKRHKRARHVRRVGGPPPPGRPPGARAGVTSGGRMRPLRPLSPLGPHVWIAARPRPQCAPGPRTGCTPDWLEGRDNSHAHAPLDYPCLPSGEKLCKVFSLGSERFFDEFFCNWFEFIICLKKISFFWKVFVFKVFF